MENFGLRHASASLTRGARASLSVIGQIGWPKNQRDEIRSSNGMKPDIHAPLSGIQLPNNNGNGNDGHKDENGG